MENISKLYIYEIMISLYRKPQREHNTKKIFCNTGN